MERRPGNLIVPILMVAVSLLMLPALALAEQTAELNEDEQAELVALVWIGRGTFSAEEYEEAVEMAKAERTNPTENYLLGIPLLADYLEAGMEKLGYTIEDIERDVL